jgi:hypothetical protein
MANRIRIETASELNMPIPKRDIEAFNAPWIHIGAYQRAEYRIPPIENERAEAWQFSLLRNRFLISASLPTRARLLRLR